MVTPTKVETRARALAATNVSPRDSAELVVLLQLPVEYDLIEKILTDDAACSLDGLVEAVRAAVRSFPSTPTRMRHAASRRTAQAGASSFVWASSKVSSPFGGIDLHTDWFRISKAGHVGMALRGEEGSLAPILPR